MPRYTDADGKRTGSFAGRTFLVSGEPAAREAPVGMLPFANAMKIGGRVDMIGRVKPDRLNVRSYPGMKGSIIGTLPGNALVAILDQRGRWLEIRQDGRSAYVRDDYVERITAPKSAKLKVRPPALNVRSRPEATGEIIGTVSRNTVIDVVGEAGGWYEIAFQEKTGFVHGDYVDPLERTPAASGVVTAPLLNVRGAPDLNGPVVGRLEKGAAVEILSRIGPWHEIRFGGEPAFVHASHIGAAPADGEDRFFCNQEAFREIALAPSAQVSEADARGAALAARTWNQFGNLLRRLSEVLGIESGTAVAVLCVESGGASFGDDGRQIIRFENHQFWEWWGQYHPEDFARHFRYGARQVWKEHAFRRAADQAWASVHADQRREWEVLDFARALDDTAALKSISMGAPQIMGFNHARIGFETVQRMFENFSRDARYHILGLFDFLDANMTNALKAKDFVRFARYYNGSGQAEDYGGWIRKHYQAFKTLGV